jgi:hypothetical protein
MENLQNIEKLEDLVVGKGTCSVDTLPINVDIKNTSGGNYANASESNVGVQNSISTVLGSYKGQKVSYNGISNSSFYLLKLGSQIRLPEGYCPGMIVNYNLEVTATCNLNEVKRAYGDCRSDVKILTDLATDNAANFDKITGDLDVVHFNKRIFTLSGDAMQNVYVHNVQITSAEFLNLRNQFNSSFSSMEKDDVFDARMMIGGGMLSNLKDKAVAAVHWLAPRIRSAVDIAKKVVDKDSDLRKYVDRTDEALGMIGHGHGGIGSMAHDVMGGMGAAHDVMGARRKKATPKVSKSDWRKYLSELQ